jgi:hypothetical protein
MQDHKPGWYSDLSTSPFQGEPHPSKDQMHYMKERFSSEIQVKSFRWKLAIPSIVLVVAVGLFLFPFVKSSSVIENIPSSSPLIITNLPATETSSPNIHYLKDHDTLPQGTLTKESASIGNIHLGDSQDAVQKNLGDPDTKSIAHSTPFPMWEYKKNNLFVLFYLKGESTPVGGVVDLKVQSSTTLKTDKNIGIGSSLNQIAAAYGDVYIKGAGTAFVDGANVTQDTKGNKYYYPQFIFNFVDNKVSGMELTNMEMEP